MKDTRFSKFSLLWGLVFIIFGAISTNCSKTADPDFAKEIEGSYTYTVKANGVLQTGTGRCTLTRNNATSVTYRDEEGNMPIPNLFKDGSGIYGITGQYQGTADGLAYTGNPPSNLQSVGGKPYNFYYDPSTRRFITTQVVTINRQVFILEITATRI